jgi:hypothetical protein
MLLDVALQSEDADLRGIAVRVSVFADHTTSRASPDALLR